MVWSSQQYTKFEAERTRPVRDLVAAVPDAGPGALVDIGCGPGNSTEVLAQRFPGREITGLDSSPDMLAAARARLPGVTFAQADIAAWHGPGPFGVILANAVLQWLPDHGSLFPRLGGLLSPGGSLAVQVPDNLAEPTHVAMTTVAAAGPWAGKLAQAGTVRAGRGTGEDYYALLKPVCRRVDIWRTTYFHALSGLDAVVEWFKGSGLRPFLQPLDEAERAAFLDRYRQAIASSYPALPDGTVLLPFPRLFVVATR